MPKGLGSMDDKLHFIVDLYQGTAEYYDRYRLPYPAAMIEDLIARTGVSGQGRLLDLACGTGQLAFPLRGSFAEVWAVDREPDFAQMVQARADKLGAGNIRPVTADAETLDADLRLGVNVRTGDRDPGVAVTGQSRGGNRKLRRLDAGLLTHPLFGDREHWFTQEEPSVQPGFFTGPAEAAGPRVRAGIDNRAVLGGQR